MNLECLNGIITDNLAIHIDLTELDSWDLNTGLTSYSLTKWSGAKSDNIDLIDFGLTGFDNGRTNEMWNGIAFTPQDTLFSMYRIGYNIVDNPTTEEYTGVTVVTEFLPMSGVSSGITTGYSGNYFELAGGYLQGFFKLDGYNYELLPPRYNEGITIETLIYLYPDSQGIFYLMGARAEDKYNPFFSGETTTGGTDGNITFVSGVTTSEDNYLDAILPETINTKAFANYEDRHTTTIYKQVPASGNTTNNVIAFEITQEKKLAYKYIDENGLIITNTSNAIINPTTGWTIIAMSFTPDEVFEDLDLLNCDNPRLGTLIFYVNGRPIWTLNDFPEFYFKAFNNDREKQLGVPYSISWGGGSFGLKYSWHYDIQTYGIYTGEDTQYIHDNFTVESDPMPAECDPYSGGTLLNGLSLSADSTTFHTIDNCDPSIEHPVTVMRIEYTGGTTGATGQTGTSANTYFIKFNEPITILSNRDYVINAPIINSGFFRTFDDNNNQVHNKISILIYGSVDIDIIEETEYRYPLTSEDIMELPTITENMFPDKQEYQYEASDGVSYYGVTGLPVYPELEYYRYFNLEYPQDHYNGTIVMTGENKLIPLQTKFSTQNASGQQIIYIGLLIETSYEFNLNEPLFVTEITYTGQDILNQDDRKDNLQIQQNFDSYFNGKIQKLRIYDNALTSTEILHNAIIEGKNNSALNMLISKGGRIIYR